MRIAVTSPSFSKNKTLCTELFALFSDVKINSEGKRMNAQDLIEYLQNADGAIIGTEQITENILQNCPKLQFIGKYGVGMDNIDTDACKKYGVGVGWTGGVNRLSVAEMALSFMLGLCRNLYKTSFQLKNGTWNKNGGFQLTGKTVGIIGVGFIGKEVIRLLEPFNCTILVNDIINQDAYYQANHLKEVTKEEIFSSADVITVHTPLTEQTKYLFNRETFQKMKPTAFVINTARGKIVHAKDLQYALENQVIAGAALDAYEEEPATDSTFLEHPNLICTPHIGGNAEEAVLAMGRSAIYHLKKYFNS